MTATLHEGKVPWDLIAERVSGHLPPEVLVGPRQGEDAALVRFGDEIWAIASDPISFTATDAGRLAVLVNANDIAVRGATPRFFLAVVLLAPGEASSVRVDEILAQIRSACDSIGVALIGGHTEVTPGISHSLVVGTMLGRVWDRPIRTGGLRPGDRICMTKWAGLEGTAILLSELATPLRQIHGPHAFRSPHEIFPGEWLSVVPEAALAAALPAVSALHDVTEGGVGEALFELSAASGIELEIQPHEVPVLPETQQICQDLCLEPMGLLGSGSLLLGCHESGVDALTAAFKEGGIAFQWIGRATETKPEVGCAVPRFPRDEILKVRLLDGIEAVVFDMDGTLIDSEYDWKEIRATLGIYDGSLIEGLNRLPSPEREARWQVLEGLERQATDNARIHDGAESLLSFLRARGLRIALVTNNSEENTRCLLQRFGLSFDAVVTRDSGLWKPSGAPVAEAIRRLQATAASCLAVGDSRYDIQAAREAQCARICVLHDDGTIAPVADHAFPNIPSFLRFLQIVLGPDQG